MIRTPEGESSEQPDSSISISADHQAHLGKEPFYRSRKKIGLLEIAEQLLPLVYPGAEFSHLLSLIIMPWERKYVSAHTGDEYRKRRRLWRRYVKAYDLAQIRYSRERKEWELNEPVIRRITKLDLPPNKPWEDI